jgi:hypothetical protein
MTPMTGFPSFRAGKETAVPDAHDYFQRGKRYFFQTTTTWVLCKDLCKSEGFSTLPFWSGIRKAKSPQSLYLCWFTGEYRKEKKGREIARILILSRARLPIPPRRLA